MIYRWISGNILFEFPRIDVSAFFFEFDDDVVAVDAHVDFHYCRAVACRADLQPVQTGPETGKNKISILVSCGLS